MNIVTVDRPRIGDWIETLSGIKFYPFDPQPEDFDLSDMCHAASREQRFGNHTAKRYSVGQHLLMCVKFAKDSNYSHYVQFLLATHDLTEAYLRDLPRPIKKYFPDYCATEDNLLSVLWHEFFKIRKPSEEELELMKYVDEWMCRAEAVELGINKTGWVNREGLLGGYVDLSEPTDQQVKESLEQVINQLLASIASREKLKAYGFSEVVLASMSDEDCDRMIKSVIFI